MFVVVECEGESGSWHGWAAKSPFEVSAIFGPPDFLALCSVKRCGPGFKDIADYEVQICDICDITCSVESKHMSQEIGLTKGAHWRFKRTHE